MNNKRLVVDIGSREAIPVRAIPYITGWRLSPDKVARQLAKDSDTAVNVLGHVDAFRLSNTAIVRVLAKEWDAIAASLCDLESQLRQQYPQEKDDYVSPDFGYAAWRQQSAIKLPADVFVWKDDFEPAFYDAYSPKNLSLIDERPGDRELVYTPLLPDGVSREVLIGSFFIKTNHSIEDQHLPCKSHVAGGDAISDNTKGTIKLWTPERVADARAMQAKLKKEGKRAFAALTAVHYGVTTTRLRAVLKEGVSATKDKQQKKAGPWDVLGQ